jgi:hypothetical protein
MSSTVGERSAFAGRIVSRSAATALCRELRACRSARCLDRHGAGPRVTPCAPWRDRCAGPGACRPGHNIGEPLDVLADLGLRRGGDHAASALARELIKRERDLRSPSRLRTSTMACLPAGQRQRGSSAPGRYVALVFGPVRKFGYRSHPSLHRRRMARVAGPHLLALACLHLSGGSRRSQACH